MTAIKPTILFSGTSHPALAKEIAGCLGIKLGEISIERFPDNEIGVQILENVRGRDVYIVQSIARDPNLYLMELLIIVDALKRASAKSIVAVIPYFGYARQDRKDKSRVPITAKLVANLMEKAGVTRLLTMNLHSEQIEGFFDIPVDNLLAYSLLVNAVSSHIKECVVVAPDIGSVKLARSFAAELNAPMAVVEKRRLTSDRVEVGTLIGNVEGRDVLLVDDLCSTGDTLIRAAEICKAHGAKRIWAAVVHALFFNKEKRGAIERLFVTNTVTPFEKEGETYLESISVAPLLAKAIQSITDNESISALYRFRK